MNINYLKNYKFLKTSVLFIILCFSVFFINNQFDLCILKENKIRNDTHFFHDSWVIGTILKSRQDGLFSTNMFTTRFLPRKFKKEKDILTPSLEYQVELIQNSMKIEEPGSWNRYYSALRLPATIYTILDKLYYKLSGNYTNPIPVFKTCNNILLSIVLVAFVCWIYSEFGFLISIVSVASILFNPISANSYLLTPIWIVLVPIVTLFWFYSRSSGKVRFKNLILITFFSIFFCQTLQYELTTIIFISSASPIFYYYLRDNWEFKSLLKNLGVYISTGVSAILCVFIIHYFLLADFLKDSGKAQDYFIGKFIQRTYSEIGNVGIGEAFKTTEGQSIGLWEVITRYATEENIYFSLNAWEFIQMQIILILVLGFSIWKWPKFSSYSKQLYAYASVPLTTLIGTLSYFVVFKSQAADHDFAWGFWNYFYSTNLLVFVCIFFGMIAQYMLGRVE